MIRFLLLGLVLAGVWYLYKLVTDQRAASAAAPPGEAEGAEAEIAADAPADASPTDAVEDLAECPVCRAYVPVSAADGCGRPDCPVPEAAAAAREEPHKPTP